MKPLLVILRPREIEECISAFRALKISKVWINFHYELDAVSRILPEVLDTAEGKGYTHLILVSDDAVVEQSALDRLLAMPETLRAVSGWVNLDSTMERSNISLVPMTLAYQPMDVSQYQLLPIEDVKAQSDPFQATFSGFALLRMPIDLWKAVDLRLCQRNSCSDHYVYARLAELREPLWVSPSVFAFHVKEIGGALDLEPRKKVLAGMRPASVVWEEEA